MKKLFSFLVVTLVVACNTVPLTGRRQVNLIPGGEIRSLSSQQYNEVLKESQVITGTAESKMVKNAGARIKTAVEQYLKDNGHSDLLDGYSWEFNLIKDDNTVNAWCMPGGKVAFYTGIMPVCKDETGVAVVMGHEVAHAIARYGNERMSHSMMQQYGGVALSVLISEKPAETQALFGAAYGLGTQYGVMLPFSRKHESEADEMGLMFMAMAGYNPQTAPEFWERMSAMSGGSQPAEFMSTHPSHSTRISKLKGWMPEAMKYYNASQAQ